MKIWFDYFNPSRLKRLPTVVQDYFRGRHNFRKMFENSAWLFGDKVIRMGIGLLIWVWLARYLGSEQFGLYNYALAFVSLFTALSSLGLDGIVVRDLVRDPAAKNELLGTAFVLRLSGAVMVLLVTGVSIAQLRPENILVHGLVALAAFGLVFQATEVIDFWFQSQVASRYTVYARNVAFLIAALAKIALILLGASLIAFAWAGLVEVALCAALLVAVYRYNQHTILAWRFRLERAKLLLASGWPLIFSSTFVYINMLVDKIMIGEISGDSEVGLYSAASRLSEIWYLIPVIVGSSVAPALTLARQRNDDRGYYAGLQMTYNFMSASSLVVAILVTLFSESIILTVYGESYHSAAAMLSIHIWSAVFVFHVSIRSRSLIIEGKQRFIALYAFLAMGSNVLLNLALIPEHGGLGASYASLFSWILCVLFFPYFSPSTRESVAMFLKSFNVVRYTSRAT